PSPEPCRTLCRCTRAHTATSASRRGGVMTQFHMDHHPEILRLARLTLGEWYVLSLIGTWPVPEREVANTTANLSQGDPRGSISESQAFRAFGACLRKEYVAVVTNSYLRMVQFYLRVCSIIERMFTARLFRKAVLPYNF